MSAGYMNKILHVDLTNRAVRVEQPGDSFYRRYLGGRDIGYHYLLKETGPQIDAFDPENRLVFATGVMTGAPIPASCRFSVTGKSPLTETAAESETAGFFGPELKKAGFDAIVFKGQANRPVWLWVTDGNAHIRDAGELARLDSGAFENAVRDQLGNSKIRVAQTGIAGMNRVLYANITNNLAHFNGRNGLGALMGAKNLRGIAALGTGKIPFAKPGYLKKVAGIYGRIDDHPISKALHDYGTTVFAANLSAAGALPVNNFRRSALDDTSEITAEAYNRQLLQHRKGCYACPIRCKRAVALDHPLYRLDSSYGGPEYETIAALGTNLNITDLKAIAKANEICSRYCMDTISAGMTIAFACECYEEGVIQRSDTGGIELSFGKPGLVLQLLEMIARREGFGDELALGTARLAKKWGLGDAPCNLTVQGQELPMHDPRVKVMVGMGYLISTHGADHMNAPPDNMFADPDAAALRAVKPLGITEPMTPLKITDRTVRTYAKLENLYKAFDALGLCVFGFAPRGAMPLDVLVECLRAATGWNIDLEEMIDAGQRGTLLARAYNFREGGRIEDLRIPGRLLTPKPDGPMCGETVFSEMELMQAVKFYLEETECDPETLRPKRSRLEAYGLGWVADQMQAWALPAGNGPRGR